METTLLKEDIDMFEKTKEFCKKHKKVIIITVGGAIVITAGILLGKRNKLLSKLLDIGQEALKPNETERALLEGFGAVYKDGYHVPFATKEVATRFMEEMGNTYQLDILDIGKSCESAVIWISKEVV
jgi:hypothetical protein